MALVHLEFRPGGKQKYPMMLLMVINPIQSNLGTKVTNTIIFKFNYVTFNNSNKRSYEWISKGINMT